MKTIEESVKEFHVKYGHLINDSPTTQISDAVKLLRIKLIQEEWDEMLELGIVANNLEQIADGAADLIYVVVGTCISYGIPIDRICTAAT
jgi:hypothetical protein